MMARNENTGRVFVGQMVPPEFVVKYKISQAGSLFCYRIAATGAFDRVISLVSVNVQDDIGSQLPKNDGVGYVQYRRFHIQKLGRFLNNWVESIRVIRQARRAKRVWFYNINASLFLSWFILKYLYFKKVYVLLADFSPPARRCDLRRLWGWAIRHSNGVLSLSSRIACMNRNSRSLAGIIPDSELDQTYQGPAEQDKRYFLFSGTLGPVTGVSRALKVFSELPDIPLVVTGNDASGVVASYAARYSNIRYLGMLKLEEYRKVLQGADFCLNFRDPELPENRNNFPSKLLEYLACGKLAVSTMCYPELPEELIYGFGNDDAELSKKIREFYEMPSAEIEKIREHNRAYLRTFSYAAWCEKFVIVENLNKDGKNAVP